MLTDALWSDVHRDGNVDLVVVGELMPITLYLNTGKRFELAKATGLEGFSGWWNSIVRADLDQDGDTDWVVGHMGSNNAFTCLLYQSDAVDEPTPSWTWCTSSSLNINTISRL